MGIRVEKVMWIEEETASKLCKRMEEILRGNDVYYGEGWELHGSPFVAPVYDVDLNRNRVWIVQIMIKRTKHE